jgi:hypothetical protein
MKRAVIFWGLGACVCMAGVLELRFGYGLGAARGLCEAIGGKHASTSGRCYTRACYVFDDCGTWSSPGSYRDALAPGDHLSKVMFWLGHPARIEADQYVWPVGKGDGAEFRATIRQQRLVSIER